MSVTILLVGSVAALVAIGSPVAARGGEPAPGSISARIAAAGPGDTVEIGPGVYREHLRIDKPLRLIGRGNPVIDGAGSGDIVEITAPDVEFAGFTVRDTGIDLDRENCGIRALAPRATIRDNVLDDVLFGIDLKEAPGSVLRNNRVGGKDLDIARRGDGIRLWRADDTVLENNTIHDGRDSILWYSNRVTIRGNTAYRCRYGFHLMFSDHVTLEDNELRENSVGVYFMYSKELVLRNNRLLRNRGPSGYGLGLKETDRFVIEGNLLVGNRVGIYFDGSPFTTAQPGVVRGNTLACNDVGATFLPAVRGNQLSGNNFIDNLEQISVQGKGALRNNDFAVAERGNFWSDYAGYDADGDGLGDFEHESQNLFESMIDREPRLRILLFSPAQQAVEFVSRALPAVRPDPKFTDPYPLIRPATVTAAGPVHDRAAGLWATGAGLSGFAAGVWLLAHAGARPPARTRRGATSRLIGDHA